ncbi:MAG: hypothetical protein K9M13_02040 [Simkaniaceae bacterium]|nr:hypothetical protein [Simkaniaceae bacterium]
MAKKTGLTDGMARALDLLRNYDGEPTLAELNEGLEVPVSSGHLTGLVRKELVESYDVEREQNTVAKLKAYTLTGNDIPEGVKLTDGMVNALELLKNVEGGATMNDLNEMSEVKVAVAHLTGLVRHGLATSEDVEVDRVTTKNVKAYRVTEAGMNYTEAE